MGKAVRAICVFIGFAMSLSAGVGQRQTISTAEMLLDQLGTAKSKAAKAQFAKLKFKVSPRLREIAKHGKTAARLDAIDLIGAVGTWDDYTLLVGLIVGSDPVVREPASEAMNMIYIRSEVELDQRYFSNKERLSVDRKLEEGRLLELWEGGPKGSATREAVDLMLWRVRVLNYLNAPDPKVGEALLKAVMTYSDGDSSINATNAPAEFNGIVDEFPSNMDHWRDALGTLWRHQPPLVLRHLRDRAFTKRTGILSVISGLPHGNIRLLLYELASDPVDSVRQAACTCLSAFKDERSKAVLRRMLTDRVALIRLEALYSLKAIDPVLARTEANRMSGDMVLEYGIRRFLEHVLEKS